MGRLVALLGGVVVAWLALEWVKRSGNVVAEFMRYVIWREWKPRR